MKKLFTLILALTGMVSTASAWNYLTGSFNNWATNEEACCLDKGPVAVYLTASENDYTFKIYGNDWFGANDYITETSTINISSDNSSNISLKVSVTGYYVFSIGYNPLTLTVRYPDTRVYFYNALSWDNVYLHAAWWNGDNGASNRDNLRGIKMTPEGNGIYSAYIPIESLNGNYFTFTEDVQVNYSDDNDDGHGNGYSNFYQTSVVWNGYIEFNASTPLYVPSTTLGAKLNNESCNYYYDVALHAYPTYTRSVTAGKFGTICVPFNATVTGATVFKIVSKVEDGSGNLTGINLESVETLEAGKAYIFKATGSTLTATYSGSYTEATEANGMLGNLSSSAISVPENYYVVSGNQIHKVVAGGDGVTIGQYRAYITLKDIEAASSRGAFFMGFDDETTGIGNVQTERNSDETIYNLQGQRMSKAGKGLFIVGGKKMLMK